MHLVMSSPEFMKMDISGRFVAVKSKSWKFESHDFSITRAVNGACGGSLVPIYRAYNNGFARGVDSNHRITSSLAAYQQQLAKGWSGEGVVMCAAP